MKPMPQRCFCSQPQSAVSELRLIILIIPLSTISLQVTASVIPYPLDNCRQNMTILWGITVGLHRTIPWSWCFEDNYFHELKETKRPTKGRVVFHS